MAGRKKVTEETMETEVQALEGAEMPSAEDSAVEESSMDQESEESDRQGGEDLPELTEAEMLGETAAETDGADTGDTEAVLGGNAEDAEPEKPKRTSRRKKAEDQTADEQPEGDMSKEGGEDQVSEGLSEETSVEVAENMETGSSAQTAEGTETASDTVRRGQTETAGNSEGQAGTSAPRRPSRARKAEAPVLTLESRGEVETEGAREDVIWHEIHNAYRTRKILTGQLGGIEQTDSGKTIVIVDYKGFRIVIPLKEMMINLVQGRSPSGKEYAELMLRQNKILGNMLGAEIDFIVKGIDSKTRSVVASRREAMLKKRQIFYLDTDAEGMYRVYEGRIVQARVIAVAEKVIRVEIFGVECSIMARDLAWDWIGDAHERFSVGDQILVRVLSVRHDSLEDMGVKADVKSVTQDTHHENLKKCRVQSKYAVCK